MTNLCRLTDLKQLKGLTNPKIIGFYEDGDKLENYYFIVNFPNIHLKVYVNVEIFSVEYPQVAFKYMIEKKMKVVNGEIKFVM